MKDCTAYYLCLAVIYRGSQWAHHHHWNMGLVPTWHIFSRSAQKGITSFKKKPLPLPGAILAHFFVSRIPSPPYTPNVFTFFFSLFGKEELLILTGVTGQQKVYQRLPKGQWCVVCLSLVSAGFRMSQEDKLGNKQVGELIDQLVAARVRPLLTQRPNQCLVISHAFQHQHQTSKGSHQGINSSLSSSSGACTRALCVGNRHIFSMWQKHPAIDYTHQLMDGHISQLVVPRYRMQVNYPQLQALSGAQGIIWYIL